MFESVRAVASPTIVVTDADLDRIEQAFGCRLPLDYRAFIKTFGPGDIDGYIAIHDPDQAIAETLEMRGIYNDEGVEPPWHLFLYDCFDDAATYFTPDDLDRLVFFASSGAGDTYLFLPGEPPHYFELPRHRSTVGDGGTTIDSFLAYLDPRTRYQPQARRIVADGVVREDDGQPDGTLYIHTFTPEGYPPPDPRPWLDREIVWGHSDDPLVTYSLGYGHGRLPPTNIDLIRDHMARYPLFTLLDAIAQRDGATRFEMEARHTPEAGLSVPCYEASLRAGGGQHGLTLYMHVPKEHAEALLHWLVEEIHAAGSEAPPGMLGLAR